MDIDKPLIAEDEKNILKQCIDDASIVQGKYVAQFEQDFAKYCGMKYGCAAINGTAALHLALAALGIKTGDEVLVPSLTFIASISPVSYCGAKPVFVDCDARTWCIDVKDLKKKITPNTKAVIPVHLYGNSCDMDAICQIAKEYDFKIVEDCAEAHGTLYKGKQVGTFSDIAFFSFYKNKHITTGEGGMCLTNSDFLNERLRLLRSHGKDKVENLTDEEYAQKQFISMELGYNYRMTDMQAAIGIAQLKKIDQFILKRIYYAQIYLKLLSKLEIVFPDYDKNIIKHTYWGVPILVKNADIKTNIMLEFRKQGIRLRPFFNPCHMQPFYRQFSDKCQVAEDVSLRGIVLPNIQSLEEEHIYKIVNLLKKTLK